MASNRRYQEPQNRDISSRSNGKNPFKRSTGRKVSNVIIIILCVVFSGLGGVIVYAHGLLAGMYQNLDSTVLDSSAKESLTASSNSSNTSSIAEVPANIDGTLIKDPMVLNIMLFGSDCLVLFYDDFKTSYSYTRIGHIEDEDAFVNELSGGTVGVTFKAGE